MRIDAKQTAEILLNNDNFIILTHSHPDGDTLGCGYALLRAFKKIGKKACVLNNDEVHRKYAFLGAGVEQDEIADDEGFVISVDLATEDLLGDEMAKRFSNKIRLAIDHHSTNNLDAEMIYLEGDSAAAAELVYLVIEEMGIEVSPDIATCIYTGVSTDTGCFKYRNTTERTLRLAAKMMSLGANTEYVNEAMFETRSRGEIELERMVLESLEFDFDNRLAIVVITQEMYRITGTQEDDCDWIASIPRKIEGVKFGVTVKERKNGTFKASIRSRKPYRANDVAAAFGGGGHENAAGCRFNGTLDEFKQSIRDVVAKVLE